VPAPERASEAPGTFGCKETIDEALNAVSRGEQLHRGAAQIRSGELGLIRPAELEEQRRPRARRTGATGVPRSTS